MECSADADTLLQLMAGWIREGERKLVLSGNVHAFNLAHELDWLRQLFVQAGAVRMDGAGIRWAAWLLGLEPPPPLCHRAGIAWGHITGISTKR